MYKDKYYNGKIRKDMFLWLIVVAMIAAIAVGGVDEASLERSEETSVPKANVSNSTISISADGTIQSISFKKDAEIRDVLRFLGAKYNKNIVPSPKVEGTITVTNLYNVTFEQTMDAILGDNIQWEQRGNIIEVYTKEDVSRMKYTVFALDYITADEAKKLIAPVLSDQGQIGSTTAAETGVPTGQSISSGTGGGDTMSLKDTIVVYDYAENIRRAEDVITAIDVRPTQVLVEASILSAKLTENMQFGIDWQTLKGTAVASLTSISSGAPDYFKSAGTSQVDKTGGMTVGIAFGDVGAFIRAVEEVTDITLLANPKILTVNKQLGQVYIGDKYGYREGDTFDAAGNLVEGQVKFLDTGTKLSFRPYIGTEGYIRVDIHSKDSSGSVPASGIPQETSAELVSNIMVKDGQTIVIGGLFRDKITNARTQVPLLGDIPIVGAAFRGTADKVERQEIIVLLTPHIITEPSQTEGEARADDLRRKRFGAKEELQWIGRARLAEDCYAKAAKYYLEGNNEAAIEQLDDALRRYPTYLEALRLKERIIKETSPEDARSIESIIIDSVERKDSQRWLRR